MMTGQLCWLPTAQTDGQRILHLRPQSHSPWRPYTSCPGYSVPDYKISGGSKGWATYHWLLKAGWTLVPSPSTSDHWQEREAS